MRLQPVKFNIARHSRVFSPRQFLIWPRILIIIEDLKLQQKRLLFTKQRCFVRIGGFFSQTWKRAPHAGTRDGGEHLNAPGTFFVVGWSTENWRHVRSENSLLLRRAPGKSKLTATVSFSWWVKWPYFFIGDKFSTYFFLTMKWNMYSFHPFDLLREYSK